MNINIDKLNQKQLKNLVKTLFYNIDVLDVVVNDMSDTNREDVCVWLERLEQDIQTSIERGIVNIDGDEINVEDLLA